MMNEIKIDFVIGKRNGLDNNAPPTVVMAMSQKAKPNTLVECIPSLGFPKTDLYLHSFIYYMVLKILPFFSYMIFRSRRSCSVVSLGLTPWIACLLLTNITKLFAL